ncbi:MOB kinase activator 2 isoform X4 [Choloepus didactylus]|uniref:MOB kinase activator 2 isoform X4 n=1 Tax=Choloepus didactylus TaxID=27675 RepID=UPI00189D40AC|nr:MOB kinase activator 2 isoform X4 [Choloepus didactylus]
MLRTARGAAPASTDLGWGGCVTQAVCRAPEQAVRSGEGPALHHSLWASAASPAPAPVHEAAWLWADVSSWGSQPRVSAPFRVVSSQFLLSPCPSQVGSPGMAPTEPWVTRRPSLAWAACDGWTPARWQQRAVVQLPEHPPRSWVTDESRPQGPGSRRSWTGREFPSSFEALVKKICKYLFHVLAHIYSSHFKETLALELHGHLNTLYAHFLLFVREFSLVDPKEMAVMDDLTEALCSGPGARGGGDGAQNHVKER